MIKLALAFSAFALAAPQPISPADRAGVEPLVTKTVTGNGVPDGTRLREGAVCYVIRMKKGDGDEAIGSVYQTIKRRRAGKVDAFAIVVHQRLANGKFDMRDEFLVNRADLRPITLDNSKGGTPHVHLDYGATAVTGWKNDKGVKTPVAANLPRPVWDGNLWGLTLAALPLRAPSPSTCPQYDSGMGNFTATATGQETVQTKKGPVIAWVVDAGMSADRRVTYLISAEGEELGYRAGPMSQSIGGSCSGM